VDEASQFYPLFGLGANVALIFSGRAVKIFSQIRAELPPDVDGWGLSLRGLMGMVVIGGLLIAAIYYWLNRTVVPRVQKRESKKKKKAKMSVGESFTFLAGSRCVPGGLLLGYLCCAVFRGWQLFLCMIRPAAHVAVGESQCHVVTPHGACCFFGCMTSFVDLHLGQQASACAVQLPMPSTATCPGYHPVSSAWAVP
jgi:hypothetical protein